MQGLLQEHCTLTQTADGVFERICDKTWWGHGLGGEVLDRLLDFGFVDQRADRICAMDVGRSNRRSRGLFESRGFQVVREVSLDTIDLEICRPVSEAKPSNDD